ncbi:MarR family winged helix-turn-helix transcriptional regulator [Streptomyces sp. NPDC087440]|uniref:MarR family winged helix-turn-helix transcriptional regulator n=1 Tax=Streptomyces sp. NPDC087440 TaxID=3365790 RepID=UPI00380B6C86
MDATEHERTDAAEHEQTDAAEQVRRAKLQQRGPTAPDGIQGQQDRLTEGLRLYGADYQEVGRRFADWLGLHTTDAHALVQILYGEERGAPLSPARLSERIQLSSGATTALLNRLEKAGHVVRTRESTTDRRIVTLRGSDRVQELTDDFFRPLGERIGAMLARYPAEQLQQFEAFLNDLHVTMNEHLAALDQGETPESPRS